MVTIKYKFIKLLLILTGLLFVSNNLYAQKIEHKKEIIRANNWALLMNKSSNLFKITPDLYRSEQPVKADLEKLAQLQIKTVISFRALHDDEKIFKNIDIKLIRIPIHTWAIKDKHIGEALWQIEQAQKPVLIHCLHGSDRTGLVAAMYRIIIQGWSIEAAKDEMRNGGYGYHTMWKNIDNFFTQEHVDAISLYLNEKRKENVAI